MKTATERFAELVADIGQHPGVTLGGEKKGFGSSALCIHGKIFAMVTARGRFTLKLPKKRVDALVATGSGTRFEPRPGRPMKEWLSLDPAADIDWRALAEEALRFVGSKR